MKIQRERPEIEAFLAAYEKTRLQHAKQVLAALLPLNLSADEVERLADDRIVRLDRKAMYWVMRRVVKQLSEQCEAARKGA